MRWQMATCWSSGWMASGSTCSARTAHRRSGPSASTASWPRFPSTKRRRPGPARAGLPTLLAVSGWAPLVLPEDGGPLFAEASRREFVAVPEASLAWDSVGQTSADETSLTTWDAADEATTRLAAAILAEDGPRVSFVYLGAVDITGHVTGAGAVYRAAALAADQRVGRLLAAVRSRPSHGPENWTIVVVTDHGHLDGGGHDGREPEVTTAWAAASGPGIRPAGPAPVTRQAEIAPLVLGAAGWPGHQG